MTSTLPLPPSAAIDSAVPSYVDATLDIDVEPPSTQAGAGLPTYPGRSARPERRVTQTQPKDFFYNIERNGKRWASLVVTADQKISKTIPTFVEGEPIKGRVELRAGKGGDDIRGVVVTLIGDIAGHKQERVVFLNISKTLWSREMGDPHQAQGAEQLNGTRSQPDAPSSTKLTQKLVGDFNWNFEFTFPKEVPFPNGKETEMYRLPQTMTERFARGGVMYEISARFLRGKLRPDNKIATPIGFIPIIYPPPFSSLRQLAYQEGLPNLLGPTLDLEGWHTQAPVTFKGTLFSNQEVEAVCQLHLAKPLSYTRGTTIPLYLTLQCGDIQALDLLSSPKVPVVRLQRTIRHKTNKEKDHRNGANGDDVAQSLPGAWWLPSDPATENIGDSQRVLNGELHLTNDLKPTTTMGHFRIEYSVILFPFIVAGFESTSSKPLQLHLTNDLTPTTAMGQFRIEYCVVLFPFAVAGFEPVSSGPLLEQPVDIVTAHAPGPRPRRLIPPGYENDQSLHPTAEAKARRSLRDLF